MAKDTRSVSLKGVLDVKEMKVIEYGKDSTMVYSLDTILAQFDELPVTISIKYDENIIGEELEEDLDEEFDD